MVDIPRRVAAHGGVHHRVVVNAEHVDAVVAVLVDTLQTIGHLVADQLADVLDDHGVLLHVSGSKQAETLY